MKNEILHVIEDRTADLLRLISSFPEDQLDVIPSEGEWSIARLAEQIYQSDCSLVKTLNGNKAVMPLPAGPFHATIRSNKEKLLHLLRATRAQIKEVIRNGNLWEECEDPVLGRMNRLALICIFISHTQRHIDRMEGIFQKLTASRRMGWGQFCRNEGKLMVGYGN